MTPTTVAFPGAFVPGITYPSETLTVIPAPDGYEWTESTPNNLVLTAVSHFKDSRTRGDIYEPFNRPSAW